MSYCFIITFDRHQKGSYKELHNALITHDEIYNWWHYIKSAYIIITSLDANELSQHFTQCARDAGIPATHLVMEVRLSSRQGRLPPKAWEWIRSQAQLLE
ncbi:MAG: hypothetical protein IT434_04550 [Phycisphaerales bacterium]|nr:hypothetical protein [Phycisphaerales bacterium]